MWRSDSIKRGIVIAYYIKLHLATLATFFVRDLLWLALIARTFYRKYLGYMITSNINWLAAIIFYLQFIVGILVFVVLPGLASGLLQSPPHPRDAVRSQHLCKV